MIDQFNRTIEYMRVSVTDRCNLRCVYCMPEKGVPCVSHSDILTYDEIARICKIAAGMGISRIKITGGEPLVRKEVAGLVRMLAETEGIEQVTMTTNGILLKENIEKLVAAGLSGVNISIDTVNAERYAMLTRGGALERAMEGLESALSFPELRVKINCVSLRDMPEKDFVELALLAREKKLDVRFIEMMPIGLGKKFALVSGKHVYDILEKEFGSAAACEGRFGNGPAVYVRFPGFRGKIGFIDAVSHKFCDKCNRIRLTSEGCLKPCLQYGTGSDLKGLLRNGADDADVRRAIGRTVYEKPACHHFSERTDGQREQTLFETKDMSQIGG